MSIYLYFFYAYIKKVKLKDSPVFIVGHQGNGATLVSRVLRKSGRFVTVTGTEAYIGGADEMQSVMGLALNAKFGGIYHKAPLRREYSRRNGWYYASDRLLPYFRFSHRDYKDDIAVNFRRCLSAIQLRSEDKRILDKSQSYLFKIDLIDKILLSTPPIYIVIVRNPLTVCYRAAALKTGLSKLSFNVDYRLQLAVEHWNNVFEEILRHKNNPRVCVYRIEDIVANPEIYFQKIFGVLNESYDDSYLPHGSDLMGIGAKRKDRWYPIRSDISSSRLAEVPQWAKDYIVKSCQSGIEYFDYEY